MIHSGQQRTLVEAGPTRGRSLPPGVRGAARFLGRDRRLWLARWWGQKERPSSGFWLWIGMNPSTAGANEVDPTVIKETLITKRQGGRSYIKCNVMDWIATHPRDLLVVDDPCSKVNFDIILDAAVRAERIICAWGLLHHRLRHHSQDVLEALRRNNMDLWCVGTTKDGSPRHPLYLRDDTKVIRYATTNR